LLVTRLTRAEHHELAPLLQQLWHHRNQPVHTFLLHQPSNKAEQGTTINFKAQFLLQSGPAPGLVFQVIAAVMEGQLRILFRIPDTGINTVENAG
jgi:hypothetical protein